ncbi:hypothetical protein RB195_018753 [Necator americanus]|uniref:Uncharacterized protein n=1 Tax=Necator americanus TaxID=51031 RepID=A0ABR1CD03_NECAM
MYLYPTLLSSLDSPTLCLIRSLCLYGQKNILDGCLRFYERLEPDLVQDVRVSAGISTGHVTSRGHSRRICQEPLYRFSFPSLSICQVCDIQQKNRSENCFFSEVVLKLEG